MDYKNKYLKYKKKYIGLKNQSGGMLGSDDFPPSGTPRHEIVDDGTKIGKVVVGEVYTIVNTGEDNNYAMRYGDWLTVRPVLATQC